MTNLANRTVSALGLALVLALPLPLSLAAQTPAAGLPPGVAILDFDNGALVRAADYAPLGKGIADMLIADLAGNTTMRLVEREQLQAILQEIGLKEARRLDDRTAIEVGKLVGARYFLTGGFMVDQSGKMVMTARAINVETSELPYSVKIEGKSENVLDMIGELGAKINAGLKLPRVTVSASSSGNQESKPTASTAAGKGDVSPQDQYRAFYLVSRSIEEQDKKNYPAAMTLLRQALDIYPGYRRAELRLASLQKIGGQ